MAQEELDVKDTEDSSPEEAEEETDDTAEEAGEVESEETDEKEEDSQDEKPETSEESKEGKETEETPEELKARLAKAEEINENLKKALQNARKPKPTLTQTAGAVPKDEKLVIDPNEYVRNLVLQAEEEAKAVLYQEFPELHPDNDTDNSVYNEFAKEFAIAAKMKGITPVSKDNFLQIGRLVMSLKTGRQPQSEAKKQASADAHKEAAKGNAASIGGTSVASKPEKQEPITDADRRAAKAVGMDIKAYMKNKNVYDDGVPI